MTQVFTTTPTMDRPTHNLNVAGLDRLISPAELDRKLPVTEPVRDTVVQGRQEIEAILRGEDERMLVIVGPCSIHDPDAALEYARKLAALRSEVADRFVVVMRVYFEKPRTTVGWKGLINDPDMDGKFDMNRGLMLARDLLLKINTMGLPAGTEFLDPLTPQYLDDQVSWAAIGARTTESQTHRQMASGLSMPVGFKNATNGSLQVALDAMQAALKPHHFVGINEDGQVSVVHTTGNAYGHVILRGGEHGSNYAAQDIAAAADRLQSCGLNASMLVDCSHANSGKKFARQELVWRSMIEQRLSGTRAILGVMIESNLFEGRQNIPEDKSQLTYGVSVTDECLGWEQTRQMILTGYERLGG